jgi:UrcA family protein
MLALILATSAASAQHTFGQLREDQNPYGTRRAIQVHYGDLDIGREEGATALLERLSVAARRVCGPADTRDLDKQVIYRRCLHVAMDRAVADAGSPLVASLYTGQPLAVAESGRGPAIIVGAPRHAARNIKRHSKASRYAQSSKHGRV